MKTKEYMNISDGSIATLKKHRDYTPDEEWEDAGYSSLEEYFQHLIDTKTLISIGE